MDIHGYLGVVGSCELAAEAAATAAAAAMARGCPAASVVSAKPLRAAAVA